MSQPPPVVNVTNVNQNVNRGGCGTGCAVVVLAFIALVVVGALIHYIAVLIAVVAAGAVVWFAATPRGRQQWKKVTEQRKRPPGPPQGGKT